MNEKSILKLNPAAIQKIWGGERLSKLKGFDLENIGETWEISIHPDGMSKSQGKKLNSFVDEEDVPYLVKLIDTSDNLSVQVHPDDQYAKENEGSSGKSECWIILDAMPGEGIYLGLNKNLSKKAFQNALKSNEDMTKYLKFHPVKRGDFFYVPAGSIHAIGKGIFLAEIQQSSGITYRVWDWNRVDDKGIGRELHVKKAMDVINFKEEFNKPENFLIRNGILDNVGAIDLIAHEQFNVRLYGQPKGNSIIIPFSNVLRHCGIMCLEGAVKISTANECETIQGLESVLIKKDIMCDFKVEIVGVDSKFIWVY